MALVRYLCAVTYRVLPRLRLCSLSLGLLLSAGLLAQGTNPFELGPDAAPAATEEGAPPPPANPFDLTASAAPGDVPAPPPVLPAVEEPPADPTGPDRGFLFGVFVGLSLLATLLVVLLRSDLQKAYRAFLNENLLTQYYREQAGAVSGGLLLLYGFSLLSVGTYVFLLVRHAERLPTAAPGSSLSVVLLGVAGLVLLKQLVLYLAGRTFGLEASAGRYAFLLLVFSIVLGFGLFPFAALLAFGPAPWTGALVLASLLGLSGLLAFRYLRALFIGAPLLAKHRFHFFLYLCSIEIAPVLLLWKALS